MIDEHRRQQALDDLGILDTPREERFDRVTRLCTRLFGVPMAAVTLIDRDRQWFKSAEGLDGTDTRRSDAFCDVAIRQPGVMVVEDATLDERFAANPYVVGDPHIRFYAGQPIEVGDGARVGALCLLDHEPRTLTEVEQQILTDLAAWVQKELVIDEELDKAAEVQRSLLPRRRPEVPGYEIAGACVPSSTVGGDFFDWYPARGGLCLTVADVMGKGMGGAIMMATVRAALRGASGHEDLVTVIRQAAATLEDDLDQTGSFVTLFHCWLDPERHLLHVVDAGHALAILVRADGTVLHGSGKGLPLGIVADGGWEEVVVRIGPGDTVVAFSDGLLDIGGDAVSEEDLERVRRSVASVVRSAATCEDIVRDLTDVAPLQSDDITVIAGRRLA